MDRRQFLGHGAWIAAAGLLSGCRGHQYAKVMQPGDAEMVGSHKAGGETFKPLVEEAVARLLARNAGGAMPAAYGEAPGRKRICFVGVENRSAEEIGDFKDQIYQVIDTQISEAQVFELVSRRYVEAGLSRTRLRPDDLLVPENMQIFTAEMQQAGQPFDYFLWATITSGTTRQNDEYQRDYLLTLELVDLRTGQFDKDSATLTKGYYQSQVSRWNKWNFLK